ncbi:MAG: hypothetical protein M3461_19400 [Pseudomonadota bacterium]|nr:hypothetical protein [Pseudomonadota bacterium]
MIGEHSKTSDVLLELVGRAIKAVADHMEIEYENGREEVFAVSSAIGVGIASLDAKSEEARLLREELYAIAKKKRIGRIFGCAYAMRVQIYDSFGEDAFRVTIKRTPGGSPPVSSRARTVSTPGRRIRKRGSERISEHSIHARRLNGTSVPCSTSNATRRLTRHHCNEEVNHGDASTGGDGEYQEGAKDMATDVVTSARHGPT